LTIEDKATQAKHLKHAIIMLGVVTMEERLNTMAYETKVMLIALAEIAKKAGSVKEMYEAIAKMANAEGVILEPYEETEKQG